MTALACKGVTYVSVGRAEVDYPLEQTAECDGGIGGCCGFWVVMREWSDPEPDGSSDVNVISTEFLSVHEQHLAHSQARAAA